MLKCPIYWKYSIRTQELTFHLLIHFIALQIKGWYKSDRIEQIFLWYAYRKILVVQLCPTESLNTVTVLFGTSSGLGSLVLWGMFKVSDQTKDFVPLLAEIIQSILLWVCTPSDTIINVLFPLASCRPLVLSSLIFCLDSLK